MAKIAFKSDNQKQSLLLPPSLDELIPLTHSVRVVNAIIDCLDVDDILHTYRGGFVIYHKRFERGVLTLPCFDEQTGGYRVA